MTRGSPSGPLRRSAVGRRALLAAGLLGPLAAAGLVPPQTPTAHAEAPVLRFDELYASFGVRGLVFAERVRALTGQRVGIAGYMAPPLQAESRFFVLTREPLALCPFCQSDAEWPVDIVVVYLRRTTSMADAGTRLLVRGRLETGSWTDPETGFVSQLRLVDADYRAL